MAKLIHLSDIANITMGQSPESSSYNEEGRGLPFFQGNVDFGEMHPYVRVFCDSPKKIANQDDILISVRAPIGAVNIADRKCCIGRGLASITPKSNTRTDFIYYFLKSKVKTLQSQGTGSTFKAINKDILRNLNVPDLSLAEQKQIAERLDKVQELIALQKEQLKKLDDLIKSRFIDLFGDPITNPKGWPLKRMGDLFKITSGGTPSTQNPIYWNNGSIPWIGSNLCQNVVLDKNDGVFITEEGLNNSSAKILPAGSVLIALVGATIGKTALLNFSTATNQNVSAIWVSENSAYNSFFVFYFVQGLYDLFMRIGSGKFKMANLKFINNLPMFEVPLSLQTQFADFVAKIEKQKGLLTTRLSHLETLYKSFMQEYFG